ncbi:unnamed protein product [Parnassius apollo]|uniref:(apollo) hypothetical protein n=1 Tax=Parnassius apollo TaxID=110799 RepID=A0A8S3XJM7_PARAO|nr:unnamed protein product [Parnassius apollo]
MSKCDNCDKSITKKSPRLECNKCGKIVHANQSCTGLSSKQLSALRNAENLEWTCEDCRKESPHRKSFIIPEDDDDDTDGIQLGESGSTAMSKILRDISLEVKKAVKMELASVNESLSSWCIKMDTINATLEILTEKVKDLEKKNMYLTNQNTHLELKVNAMEQQIRIMEQKQLDNVLEITGIPEDKDENLEKLSSKIASKLNVEKRQAYMVKRLKGRDGKEGVIQVVLQQEEQVDQWIRAARTETIALEDITPNAPNPEVAKRRVLLRRALTKANKTLLWQTKQTLKETYKYIWFQGGKVLARKFDNDKPVIIRSSCDIDKLSTQKYR